MLRYCLFLFAISSAAFAAEDCRFTPEVAIRGLKNKAVEPDLRARQGSCLIRFYLDRADAAQALLTVIRDRTDDMILREDLMIAFSEAPLRKRVKLEGAISPEIGKQEKTAMERTVASAGNILAVTQAVKSMDEIIPSSRYEAEFVRALVDVALEEENHVVLRGIAVDSLERVAKVTLDSGVYDAKSLKLTHDTLRALAFTEDSGYYSGAKMAFSRIEQNAELIAAIGNSSGRSISSQGPAR